MRVVPPAAMRSDGGADHDAAPAGPVGSARVRSVVVVDDHEVLRAGTRQILDASDGFTVIGEAAGVEDALRVVRELRPEVVLVDVRLPDGNGIDAARRMLQLPEAPTVLVLSAFDEEHYVQAAMAAGVAGYILKTAPAHELVSSIRVACDHPGITGPVGSGPAPSSEDAALTPRESEIVRLVARGLANKQIAHLLEISPRTVEGHLNHVFDKVGVGSRTELVHVALSHGLLSSGTGVAVGDGIGATGVAHTVEPSL